MKCIFRRLVLVHGAAHYIVTLLQQGGTGTGTGTGTGRSSSSSSLSCCSTMAFILAPKNGVQRQRQRQHRMVSTSAIYHLQFHKQKSTIQQQLPSSRTCTRTRSRNGATFTPSCVFLTTTTSHVPCSSFDDDGLDDTPSTPTTPQQQSSTSTTGSTTGSPTTASSSSPWKDEQSLPTSSSSLPQQQQRQTRRRIRYNGKYPKQYSEKYKELNGDTTTIQKVLQKGMTPAGQHIPIMMKECMEHLGLTHNNTITTTTTSNITTSTTILDQPSQRLFVDCTLGYGGHSTHVLQHLLSSQQQQQQYQMICFDRDPIEFVKATERLQNIVTAYNTNHDESNRLSTTDLITTVNRNFCELRTYLDENYNSGTTCAGKVTCLLADLGLSSMQIDDASRGFTYKHDGPLDMRMTVPTMDNTSTTESAYDLLRRITVPALTKLLQDNSDEIYAPMIAEAILRGGGQNNIPSTTLELANIVRETVRPYLLRTPSTTRTDKKQQPTSTTIKKQLDSTVSRVMQAIRIEVNSEFDTLQQLLDDLPYLLTPNVGRAVLLTFHSGEDRRVKQAFKQGFKNGIYSSWSRDVVRPTSHERYNNPRSSCCKLRWVVRSDKLLV